MWFMAGYGRQNWVTGKIDATSKIVKENTATLNEQSEKIEDVSGQVSNVTGDVTRIKKLKSVRGSR